jgi:hypothetical protein
MEKAERRSRRERRSGIDRRKVQNSNYNGLEKRSNSKRRSGTERRKDS